MQKEGAIAVRSAQRARLEALLTRKAKRNVSFVRKAAFSSMKIEPRVRYANKGITLIEKDRQIANNVRTV